MKSALPFDEVVARDARLCILRELANQTNGQLNDATLLQVLDIFGFNRSREWLRTQLNKLEELGAVQLSQAGTVVVAELRRAGRDHVERRAVIDGISRPSDAA